jgi:Xaa-Pro dipeptidase
MDRRHFLKSSAIVTGATLIESSGAEAQQAPSSVPEAIRALKPMTAGIVPITDAERQSRIEKARRLMTENGIGAMFLEGGSSMFYYTGVRWGNSERPFGVVIPAKGELAYVTPGFEESRAREMIKFSNDVRVWQEDESPYKVIAGILRDRGVATGKVGMEERVRFFIVDGVKKEMPGAEFVIATPVTAGCRMIKSAAEIALMQRANDITLTAIRAAYKTMRAGMSQGDLSANVAAAHRALGVGGDGGLVLFGDSSAFPHGSLKPKTLREGDVVLIDTGCQVEGYSSDITRTTVFGTPSKRERDVWDVEKRAQAAALAAAKVGATCESVDAAARKVITDAGFGPGYKLPGAAAPHRATALGWTATSGRTFVRGNTTKIQPGMCFSDEPTIAIPGEFGNSSRGLSLHHRERGEALHRPVGVDRKNHKDQQTKRVRLD